MAEATVWQAQIWTAFSGAGTAADPYRPQLAEDYALAAWADVTGATEIQPAPAGYVIAATCDGATLAAIAQDGRYVIQAAEEVRDGAAAAEEVRDGAAD